MAKNINEVEIDMSDIDWNELSRRAIEFEMGFGNDWNGCVSAGVPPKMTDKEKLEFIRYKLGGLIGLASKNDDDGVLSVCMWVLDVIDGKL